jgi:hypothetical protein
MRIMTFIEPTRETLEDLDILDLFEYYLVSGDSVALEVIIERYPDDTYVVDYLKKLDKNNKRSA